MKVAICDDEIIMITKLKNKLEEISKEHEEQIQIACYTDGELLVEDIKKSPFDLILVDIDMPKMDGFTLAKNIRELELKVDIIFITNHDDMVYDAFEYNAYYFLRKSKLDEKFETVLYKWMEEYRKINSEYIFEGKENSKIIKIEDVLYVEVCGHEISLHLKNQEQFVLKYRSMTMTQLDEDLNQKGFLRIHQSYLVNYREISEVGKEQVVLKNGDCIPVSRDRHKEIRQEFHRCIRRRKG